MTRRQAIVAAAGFAALGGVIVPRGRAATSTVPTLKLRKPPSEKPPYLDLVWDISEIDALRVRRNGREAVISTAELWKALGGEG
jgi:hypothetical protein